MIIEYLRELSPIKRSVVFVLGGPRDGRCTQLSVVIALCARFIWDLHIYTDAVAVGCNPYTCGFGCEPFHFALSAIFFNTLTAGL